MSISAFGAVFIPVAVCIFLFLPRYLVPLMVVSSIFVAASVLDFSVGDSVFGVQPYYFAAALLGIRGFAVLLTYRRRKRELQQSTGNAVGTLIEFWKWAAMSAFVFPVVFKGMEVIDPRSVEGDIIAAFAINGQTSPLRFGFGNVGQVAYLTLSVIAVLYAAGTSPSKQGGIDSWKALRVAIVIVSLVAILQAYAGRRGWNFPHEFFNSNPAYLQSFVAEFEGVPRVNSTFTEASYAGGFLAAGALGLLAMRLQWGRGSPLEVLLAALGLALTTSTTGYLTFLAGGLLLLMYLAHSSLHKGRSGGVRRKGAYLALLAAGALAFLIAVDPPLQSAILEMTVNKADSVSFFARLSADWYSLTLLAKTYGLGVGLGGNRPSSLGAALLGNVGVIGTALFVLCVWRFLAQLFTVTRQKQEPHLAFLAWMMIGLLIAYGVALPDLSLPPLWAVMVAAAGMLASRTSSQARVCASTGGV